MLHSAIDEVILGSSNSQASTIRNAFVPKKLEIFVWRTFKKRIPVKLELDKRGIDLHSMRCPLCDEDLESVEHSIVLCKSAFEVWERIHKWWNLSIYANLSLNELLGGGSGANTNPTFGNSVWLATKWVGAYYIWKNRNNMVFRGKSSSSLVTLNEIQSKSFEWISSRSRFKKIDWHMWLTNPSAYLICVSYICHVCKFVPVVSCYLLWIHNL
ncbi:uncharacterized protein [Rutidosis leptorrhynchoides]|uniref:uncharacterized protein n=1 Tax=Rutidosis leptorrhynchoides TaxID=125765 RepID=UPI003A9A2183